MNSIAPFAHEALFYRDEDDFVTSTTRFIADGVHRREPVLVAVPETGIALLRDTLGGAADEVHFIDITEAGRNPGRIIPGVLMAFSASAPERRFRIVGEPVWPGRTELEYPACVQHEALINVAFEGRRGTILCSYNARSLPEAVLADARRTHPIVIDGEQRFQSEQYADPSALAEFYNVPLPPPPPDAEEHAFSVGTLAQMRKLVTTFADTLRRQQVEDLVLAVNELATNSILHASGRGVLRMWREDGTVVCEVSDTGSGCSATSFTGFSGFGFVMVNLLCDLVRTHTSHSGTTVRVYLGQ